jgi:hypothetical protein
VICIEEDMAVTYLTLERSPMVKSDSKERQRFKVRSITLAVRKGIEVQLNSDEAVDPTADCWFALDIEYQYDQRAGAGGPERHNRHRRRRIRALPADQREVPSNPERRLPKTSPAGHRKLRQEPSKP